MTRSKLPLLALLLAFLALLLLPAAGLGARAGIWPFRAGFQMLRWAAYLGAAAALVSVVLALVPRTRRGNGGALAAALLAAFLAFGIPFGWLQRAKAVPPIHDITTDTQNPPAFVAVLPLRQDAPNPSAYGGAEVASAQQRAYPDVRPLVLAAPPQEAFGRALAQARRMGWTVVAADPATGRIEATDTTTWFGFKDDVVVRIVPEGTGSRVDVRSVSRVGKSDVGTNAQRIRAFLAKLER